MVRVLTIPPVPGCLVTTKEPSAGALERVEARHQVIPGDHADGERHAGARAERFDRVGAARRIDAAGIHHDRHAALDDRRQRPLELLDEIAGKPRAWIASAL